VTDHDEIAKSVNEGEGFWIYTKDPSVQALRELLDRALDKPAQQVEVAGADQGPVVFRWLEPGETI
jgi:hypothetical protein